VKRRYCSQPFPVSRQSWNGLDDATLHLTSGVEAPAAKRLSPQSFPELRQSWKGEEEEGPLGSARSANAMLSKVPIARIVATNRLVCFVLM
jgi:hypothetical protein